MWPTVKAVVHTLGHAAAERLSRTADIAASGRAVGTATMTDHILAALAASTENLRS